MKLRGFQNYIVTLSHIYIERDVGNKVIDIEVIWGCF